jgi:DNA-binding PadR family transcriptional regulator
MTFDELDEALNRLEKRGVITAEGEGDARRYRLTAAGKALPAD